MKHGKILTNYTKENRKELVKAIEAITGQKSKYIGAPSMAYSIGEFTVTREGGLESEDSTALEQLAERLETNGFMAAQEREEAPQEHDGLCIYVPRDTLPENAVENLKHVSEAKQELFKRVFGGNITILVEEDRIGFPWFPMPENGDETKAYTRFVESICNMARIRKRVSLRQHPVENEKYEFRCFLLGLGFIGKEYKEERKILLKNLKGSAAFKSDAREVAI